MLLGERFKGGLPQISYTCILSPAIPDNAFSAVYRYSGSWIGSHQRPWLYLVDGMHR